MTPFYQDDLIQIFHCRCEDFMAECADKQFELCIVDPPYGIGQPKQSDLKGYNGRPSLAVRLQKNRLNQGAGKLKDRILNNSNCEWDNNIPDDNYFEELFRITQNQIIWGGNYFPLPPTRGMLCWDKVQPWENFSQIELAWTSFDVPAKLFKFDNRTGGKIHPTEKPIPLYKYCLQNYAKPGWTIFDSHGGSLSIAIACHDLGFELVACECDLDYLTAAVNRIKNYLKQPKWFKPVTTTPTQGRLWRDE